jgi:hypothetical protein
MSTAVREILDKILRLPQDQRAEFESELARLEEKEWPSLVDEARQTARRKGLDDETIARAVESLRYGDGAPKP